MPFVLIMNSKEVRPDEDRPPMTKAHEPHWVIRSEFGPTTRPVNHPSYPKDQVPEDVLTWPTLDEATTFARNWLGHPWYFKPDGDYKIFEVKPTTKVVQTGWERA